MSRPAQVLLVEDSPTQAARMLALLEDEGLAAKHVGSAEAALPILSSRPPDLLIVDYNLPGMRGDELCRRVRLDPALVALPILILTGEERGALERQGLESGADEYLPKTIAPATLGLRIRSLLARGAQLGGGAEARAPHRPRCLVVDDSATQLAVLESELGREGYDVVGVTTPADALAALGSGAFDCVIGDLVMPGMNGAELCREIDARHRRDGVFLPIIILTARDDTEAMAATFEAGADDFLVKSADLTTLKTRLRVLLRRKSQFDEAQRIAGEFRRRDDVIRTERAGRAEAEERAALAQELERANGELAEAYRTLQETQSRLVQSAKMASLGELVAGIAHEINNPLAFVLSHLETVRRRLSDVRSELDDVAPPQVRDRLAKAATRLGDMREGLDRVADLVLKLRTFSRLDEGRLKTVDVNDSLDSTLRILAHRLGGEVKVIRNYCERADLFCYAGELNQVFMNILANSIDAMEGRGTIEIETGRDDAVFRVMVRDTGPGIPAALRERVFEPFFTTKDVGKGTGLGLAISYSIVQRHGGAIEIGDNPSGTGAEISITLPTNFAAGTDHPLQSVERHT